MTEINIQDLTNQAADGVWKRNVLQWLRQVFSPTTSVIGYAYSQIEVLSVQTTLVGNVGGGEDDLMSYTLPAGKLASDGDFIDVWAHFHGNAADLVTVNFYFGTEDTTFLAGDTITAAGQNTLFFRMRVVRINGTLQTFSGFAHRDVVNDTYSSYEGPTLPAQTLANALTVKFTGRNTTDTSDNAVVQNLMIVTLYKAP